MELGAERAVPVFQAELAKCLTTDGGESEPATDRLAERQARAAIALVRLGKAESIWPLLRHSPDPRLRSFIINWLAPLGVEPKVVLVELRRLAPTPSRHPHRPIGDGSCSPAPETSIRRALLITLGTYGPDALSSVARREPLVATLFELYKNDPDAGVHGTADGHCGSGNSRRTSRSPKLS